MRTERQGACVHLRTCAVFVCGSICLCCDTEMKAREIRRGEGLRHSHSDPPRRSQKVFKSENSVPLLRQPSGKESNHSPFKLSLECC